MSAQSMLPRSAFNIFTPVQRELDRALDQLGAGWSGMTGLDLRPRMDFVETKDAVELTFELPGLTRSDVKIAMEDDVLTVRGEKKAEKEIKEGNGRILERSYGAFERAVALPRTVDASKITATMADGVLKISAPKTAPDTSRTIEIKPN